jgi:glycosyltransferase involved in cell wall biosynthesis
MKIGVSAFAGDSGKSGISQYMKNIFKRLPEFSSDDEYVMFMAHSDREHFDYSHENVRIVILPNWLGHPLVNILWHLVCLPIMLAVYRCDCVYLPAGNRRLAWFYGVPSIGTVHDLSQLHVEGKYDPFRMFYCKKVLPFLMRRLNRVISVSGATLTDLEQHAGVDSRVIDVVYNGADLEHFSHNDRGSAAQRVRQKYDIAGPYILYTARLEHPGKNHVRLLEAFADLKRENGIPHHLILAGSPWRGVEAIYAAAQDLGISEHVIFAGFVPNEELPDLYAGADLFAFPSLFEGFGIPLLEAMASGTPVVASNVASIPEVVQDAGLLFDPANTWEIKHAIAKLSSDPGLKESLAELGLQQSKHFSWDDSARQVWDICHAAVAAGNTTSEPCPKAEQA